MGTPTQFIQAQSQQQSQNQSKSKPILPSFGIEEFKKEENDKMDEPNSYQDIQSKMNYPKRHRGRSKEKMTTE